MLSHPDINKPFAIQVDASNTGMGAVLFQPKHEGDLPDENNIVQFWSRKLKEFEEHKHAYELEIRGLVEGILKFDAALYGRHFTVYTDCQSLTFLET